MLTRQLYKSAFLAISFFLIPLSLFGYNVEIQPREVNPGDVIMLRLVENTELSAYVDFMGKRIDFHSDGRGSLFALVPVDVSTKPNEYTMTVHYAGEIQKEKIKIHDHAFKTIHLTLPEEKVTLSPQNQKRVEKEYLLQNKIWSRVTTISWSGSFARPTHTEISTEYGVKRIMNKKKTSVHRGMDFRGKSGTPVNAINSGKVILAQDLFYGGNTLIIDHGMGLYSVYMHLSKIHVTQDAKVSKGQVVGLVGMSGRATGPHLHLSVKLNGVSVNPESLFKLKL